MAISNHLVPKPSSVVTVRNTDSGIVRYPEEIAQNNADIRSGTEHTGTFKDLRPTVDPLIVMSVQFEIPDICQGTEPGTVQG